MPTRWSEPFCCKGLSGVPESIQLAGAAAVAASLLAAAAYDPYSRGRDAIVHHLFEEQGIRVVKFEVSTGSGLMATHPVFALDGEVMCREAAFAAEHGLVFVIDIGKLGSPSSQIGALRRLILRHPDMKFVVCHLLAPKQTELAQMTDEFGSAAPAQCLV